MTRSPGVLTLIVVAAVFAIVVAVVGSVVVDLVATARQVTP